MGVIENLTSPHWIASPQPDVPSCFPALSFMIAMMMKIMNHDDDHDNNVDGHNDDVNGRR